MVICSYAVYIHRYMNGPQKEEKIKKKINHLKNELHAARKEINRLKKRIEEVTAVQGIVLDEALQRDLLNIMRNNHINIHQQFLREIFREFFGTSNCRLKRWEI